MSAAVRERTTTHASRKIVSHGGPISGQRDGAATASSLENNLDALLEDLQTSVSRSATPSRDRALLPQIEYRVAANPARVISEGRSVSPSRSKVTTTEKFVSTGPTGMPSGIPGLEELDAELQDVQPGQSKTIAYKQVSYHYNKDLDGKPDSWIMSENKNMQPLTGVSLIDDVHETSYEESKTPAYAYQSPDPIIKKTVTNKKLIYSDSPTSHSKHTSLSRSHKDAKYIHDSSYRTDPRSTQSSTQEYKTIEYVPSPSPTVPISLAPGPNTKVTTTIKTYTYELPGAPETYLPGRNQVPGSVVLPGDQTITYTLPRTSGTDKTVTYQTVTENIPGHPGTPVKYGSSPSDVTEKSTTMHKEAKFYREEHHGGLPYGDSQPTKRSPYGYRTGPPGNTETKTTVTEKYYQADGSYPNGHGLSDRPDYSSDTAVIYQNQPPTSTTPQSSTTVYKYSNTTTTVPPNKNADDHEVLLPKPFPTGVQVYPAKPISNGEGPPAKLEDLMASFSDSERGVLGEIERKEQRRERQSSSRKKEVEFSPHTPPQIKSKNVAGPPVYYPPGSAEFTKKEESSAAVSQAGGEWQKAKGKYEYEASSKSKSKSSKGKTVVPVCLPLCCALPCVIM